MHLHAPSQTETLVFMNSLGESCLKLYVVDANDFTYRLGRDDCYDALSLIVAVSYNIIGFSNIMRLEGECPCLEDL